MSSIHWLQLKLKGSALTSRRFSRSKANPFAIVYLINGDGDEEAIGRTEISEKTLHPDWLKVFPLKHQIDRKLNVKVVIYDCLEKVKEEHIDIEKVPKEHSKYRHLGSDRFNINEILKSSGNYIQVQRDLTGNRGCITVCLERTKLVDRYMTLSFQLRGMGLVRTIRETNYWNRMSNSFFEISRKLEKSTGVCWDKIYRSEIIKNHINPVWKRDNVDLRKLCNNDFKREIRIQVFDVKRSGKQRSIGSFETNLEELLASKSTRGNADLTRAYTVLQDNVEVGKVVVVEAEIQEKIPIGSYLEHESESKDSEQSKNEPMNHAMEKRPSFNDYRFGGCKISVSVAIDFSSKNGNYTIPDSPHFLAKRRDKHNFDLSNMNDYQKAIFVLGSMLEKYDSTQAFPVFGFGVQKDNTDLQLFQCGMYKEVMGVTGILDAYEDVRIGNFLPSTKASLVANIMLASRNARKAEKHNKDRLSYSILLILTEGELIDLEETKKALRKASSSPLSVIIVKIGNEKCQKIHALRTDNGTERRNSQTFIEFNTYSDKEELTQNLANNISSQLVDYFWSKGLSPHYM